LVVNAKNPIDAKRTPETIAKILTTLSGAVRDASGNKIAAAKAAAIPIKAKVSRSLIEKPRYWVPTALSR
jgi:hypothetical protein